MKTEEDAKIIAGIYNGFKLDKKHTFSCCIFPEYEKKIKQDENQQDSEISLKDKYLRLNNHMLETRKSQYAFQVNKKVHVGALHGMTKILWNLDESEREVEYERPFESDKPYQWSPKGTYLVLVKSDKVEFLSGHDMQPILSIQRPKVDTVIFSPCEKYIVLYMPKAASQYEVWNFQTVEMIRDFEQ